MFYLFEQKTKKCPSEFFHPNFLRFLFFFHFIISFATFSGKLKPSTVEMFTLRKINLPSSSTLIAARTATSATASKRQNNGPNVVVIDAVRTPFAVSSTVYKDLLAVDLQRAAFTSRYFSTIIDYNIQALSSVPRFHSRMSATSFRALSFRKAEPATLHAKQL